MKRLNIIIMALSITLVSACGWHLRGQVDLGPELGKLYVSGNDSHLLRELKSSLQRNGVELIDNGKKADFRLSLSPMSFDRRTAAVGSQILAAEYELNMRVDYRIAQQSSSEKPYQDASRAATIRSYSYDPNNTLGKDQEERILRKEMRADMIQQILRRLALVKTSASAQ